MSKLPSLQQLVIGFERTLKRFPLEILVSITGSVSFIMLVYSRFGDNEQSNFLLRLMLVSILALTLLLSASVYSERKKVSRTSAYMLKAGALALIVGLFFFLDPMFSIVTIFRYAFLLIAFHLLVSFAPFIGEKNLQAFWEYNKRLFLRILLSALYSTVLFGGLCIALVCIDELFNAGIDERTYAYLAAVVYGIFNTVFFLAGVPENWAELDAAHSYPKGLKIFTQFVLIPLATIYFCILLVYEGKLIIDWALPQGLVSSLVIGYAVYGILSILLVYPVRQQAENKWLQTFSRLFYVLLIPLIALLGVAIFTRVIEYGITEPRYILVVLSCWLTGITLFFLLSRSENIKVIPISLCVVALLSVWGPQSATSVSLRSQTNELITVFDKNGAYHNETFQALPELTSSEEFDQADDIIDFIVERDSLEPFRGRVAYNVDSLYKTAGKSSYLRASALNGILGIKPSSGIQSRVSYYAYADNDTIPISTYRYFIPVKWYSENQMFKWDEASVSLELKTSPDRVSFNLKPIFESVVAEQESSRTRMGTLKVIATSKKSTYLLVFETISFSSKDGKYTLDSFDGYLLVNDQ